MRSAATGVLLSEYPPGTEPLPGHFPVRNRIISGLSLASLVVEAPVRSGALITAHAALDQGRDVFAVPGPIDAAASVGCNRLIRDGAGLAASGWDILSVYHSRFPHRLHPAQMTVPEPGETPGRRKALRRHRPRSRKPLPHRSCRCWTWTATGVPGQGQDHWQISGAGLCGQGQHGSSADLPKSTLGVDVENDFEPNYRPIKGKEDIIKDLKTAAKTKQPSSSPPTRPRGRGHQLASAAPAGPAG